MPAVKFLWRQHLLDCHTISYATTQRGIRISSEMIPIRRILVWLVSLILYAGISEGQPTFTFTARPPVVATAQTSALSWPVVANATTCTASVTGGTDAGWTGSKSIAGGLYTAPTPSGASTTYRLSCTGPGGTVFHDATVTKNTIAPYAFSTLATVTYNAGTVEQHGVPTPASFRGADQWWTSWASDDNVYGYWGDGAGWDVDTTTYAAIGVTRLTGAPGGTLDGVDVFGSSSIDRKPMGFVADASGVMRGFYTGLGDSYDHSWAYSSANQGTSWTDPSIGVFSLATDAVNVAGMAQFGPGYTGHPAGTDGSYYYVYLWLDASHPSWGNIYLSRVPKASWSSRAAYTYYAGLDGSQQPVWSSTFASKQPVFVDLRGSEYHFYVVWFPGLNRYLALKGQNTRELGIWEGDTLWGPWRTLYYGQFRDTAFKFTYTAPAKWMASNGSSFWVTYSGEDPYDNLSLARFDVTLLGDTIAPAAPTNLRVVSP
jgi:hypothetical protein